MLPHHFVPIDKVPMTSNNKVDLEALPVPGEQAGEADSANIVLPANEREQQMLAIWRQMLNRSDLGVTSDYFEHGGDSIRAIELIARLNRELDLKLETLTCMNAGRSAPFVHVRVQLKLRLSI